MKLILTEKSDIEDLCFLEWRGRPAVFVQQAYWSYEFDQKKQELTLLNCLGKFEFI